LNENAPVKIVNDLLWINPKSALNFNSRRMTKLTIAHECFNDTFFILGPEEPAQG
jgi:hypothetical protein